MRKLNELYTELRQVHKRLESDIRGTRLETDYHFNETGKAPNKTRVAGTRSGAETLEYDTYLKAGHDDADERDRGVSRTTDGYSSTRARPLHYRGSARGSESSKQGSLFDLRMDTLKSGQGFNSRSEPRAARRGITRQMKSLEGKPRRQRDDPNA